MSRVFLPCLAAAILGSTPINTGAPFSVPPAAAEPAQAGRADSRLETAMRQQAHRLSALASDDEALSLYRSDLARALAIQDTTPLLGPKRTGRRRPGTVPYPVLKTPALLLVKKLARWGAAQGLREAADAGEAATLMAIGQRESQRKDWLLNDVRGGSLARALRIASVIAALEKTQTSTIKGPAEDFELAAYLDRTYPALATGPQSWLAVAEQEGSEGVRQRMVAYWQREDGGEISEEAMRWYFDSRLRPVFLAQVAAFALMAEAEAQQQAGALWQHLRSWREDWSVARGRTRLCGTWSWIVHNHQNHQDHNMMVTFPPPDLTPDGPAFPKTIVVLGDSVYLRWEFPGGYQEDSLLFSGKDRRLEGTFVNSRGPYGAITGKKVKKCRAER